MAKKYDLFKYVYDNTEDKEGILNEFPETIREDMKKCLETGDEGLFEQLMTPTALSEEGPAATAEIAPAPACIESATLPEGDVTDIAQDNMDVIIEMDKDVHAAAENDISALPEDIQEGVGIWRDASEDMSKLIVMGTYNALKGSDFSEEQVLCTGATVAKDLQDSGYGKTSLSRASDKLNDVINMQALDKLCYVKDELESLRAAAEEVVDHVSEEDNLGLTPSQKDKLVAIILENGIFTDDPDHDMREDVKAIINTSGDYSAMEASVQNKLLEDFSGYEFSMEECDDLTNSLLSSVGSFDGSMEAVDNAIFELSKDCASFAEWNDARKKAKTRRSVLGFDAKGKVTDDVLTAAAEIKKLKNQGHSGILSGIFDDQESDPFATPKSAINFIDTKAEKYINKFYTEPQKAKLEADTKVKLAQAKAIGKLAKYNPEAFTALNAAPNQNAEVLQAPAGYKLVKLDGSENDATEQAVLMNDEALAALVSKYTMLPTLEAKSAMVQDMQEHGVPEEYISAMVERSKGEFSEEFDQTIGAESVIDPTQYGSDELAAEGETQTTDPVDGTLPVGEVQEEGVTQEEMAFDNLI